VQVCLGHLICARATLQGGEGGDLCGVSDLGSSVGVELLRELGRLKGVKRELFLVSVVR
jgi:hypothetical protein